MFPETLWAGLIIAVTLVGVAVGRIPGLSMNRATIALAGAVGLVVVGALPLRDAFRHLEMNTLSLLFAMMVLNVHLCHAGFFRWVAARVVSRARSPRQLLALTIAASGVLSAAFLNDTIVLMLTPLVIDIARCLKRDPVPYLLGLATAANIGSSATIGGNPQNMLIGMASGIPYLSFLSRLWVPVVLGMGCAWVVLVVLYRADFRRESFAKPLEVPVACDRGLMIKSLAATAFMLVGFLMNMPMALAALIAATLLLVTRRIRPEIVFREIDWGLLVFFAGLFVVTAAISAIGASDWLFDRVLPIAHAGVGGLAVVGSLLANLVSNVPAVMLVQPLVPQFPNPEQAWLTLAMSTTMAGNLTLLGSVANLIVAESAKQRGVEFSFMAYLRAGVPITLLSTLIGVAWLSWVT